MPPRLAIQATARAGIFRQEGPPWPILIDVTVYVQPQGLSARLARPGEVAVWLWDVNLGAYLNGMPTEADGVAHVGWQFIPGGYIVLSHHIESGARQMRGFVVTDSGHVSFGAEASAAAGAQLPATFSQPPARRHSIGWAPWQASRQS